MLASLMKVTYPNFETLVVDNGSPKTSPDIIKQKYPEVQLIIVRKIWVCWR
jgi:glycosyltransferase involved in cell wall biosynthesis